MILFYGDFIVKLAWRLFGNLIYHVFLIKTRDKLHNFYIVLRQHNFSSDQSSTANNLTMFILRA